MLACNLLKRQFGSLQKVVLIRDNLPLGYEGQLVRIKPLHASNLIKEKSAVAFFPGILQRMYPKINQENLDNKIKQNKLQKLFMLKTKDIKLNIDKPSSFTNPTFLKEVLPFTELISIINSRINLQLKPDNFDGEIDIKKFGDYQFNITNYEHFEFKGSNMSFQITIHMRNTELFIQ